MARKSKRRQGRRREQEQSSGFGAVLRGVLMGSGAGTVAFFALLCLASLISLKMGMQRSILPYLGIAMGAVSAFVAGLVAVKRIGKNGLFMGGISVLPELLIVLLTVLFTGTTVGLMTLFLALAMLVASAAGGILAVNSGK